MGRENMKLQQQTTRGRSKPDYSYHNIIISYIPEKRQGLY